MLEQVSLTIAGAPFATWFRLAVHASVKHAERTLAFEFVDTPGAPSWPQTFKGQPEAIVKAGGDLIFTGAICRVAPRIDPRFYHVSAEARTAGQDAIDGCVDHTRPDYANTDLLAIARDQDRFNCRFACDFTPEKIDRWRPNPGRSLFDSLAPLCEEEGATMAGQADGSVKITRAGENAKPQGGPLVEGDNIVEATASFDDSGQHSKVEAHGQSAKGTGAQALQIVGTAENSEIARTRPLVLHHDRDTSRDRLKGLAKRRRDKEQGEGTRAQIKVKGWRDSSGQLWTPGNKVWVQSPSLALAQYLLIEQAVYEVQGAAQSGEGDGGGGHAGTSAMLALVDPRAHGGKGSQVNKSGSGWGFDGADAY